MSRRILVVDDDQGIRDSIKEYLTALGYEIETAVSFAAAQEIMSQEPFDIVLTDKNMPGANGNVEGGMDVLRYIRKHAPTTSVIMITGYASIETAIKAMKLGAFDFITKPFKFEDLAAKIDRALEYQNFLDPERTLHLYRMLHNTVLDFLEDLGAAVPEKKQHQLIRRLDSKFDYAFEALKGWERIIIDNIEAMGTVASFAEQLMEDMPTTDPLYPLVEGIHKASARRL